MAARFTKASIAMAAARRAGVRDGEKTEHAGFPASIAQPDPAANFLEKTRGKLGAGHKLDY